MHTAEEVRNQTDMVQLSAIGGERTREMLLSYAALLEKREAEQRELSAAQSEVKRLREAFTVHLAHYNKDGYRICTEEFMREVVKESRAALAATRKESSNG